MRFLLLLVCLLAYSSAAHAQALPAALMMRPSMLEPIDPELRFAPIERDFLDAQRRHRLLMATGIGALTAATVHAGLLGNFGGCGRAWPESVSRRELLLAGAAGALGLGLTIGSGVSLARVPKAAWRRASPAQKAGAVFTSLAAASATEALLMLGWAKSDSCF